MIIFLIKCDFVWPISGYPFYEGRYTIKINDEVKYENVNIDDPTNITHDILFKKGNCEIDVDIEFKPKQVN